MLSCDSIKIKKPDLVKEISDGFPEVMMIGLRSQEKTSVAWITKTEVWVNMFQSEDMAYSKKKIWTVREFRED